MVRLNRAILHDPVAYPDPLSFKPERFILDGRLNPAIRDPIVASFGFGRVRILENLTITWVRMSDTWHAEDMSWTVVQRAVVVYHCRVRSCCFRHQSANR
jgi:hypothetical protein